MNLTFEQLREMQGINNTESKPFVKLNEIRFSGDNGEFTFIGLLNREEGEQPEKQALGKEISGVILKMRWRLFNVREIQGKDVIYSSSEYDSKNTDTIAIFTSQEGKIDDGKVEEMKQQYNLKTQRILYIYIPERKEIVRMAVKASAFNGNKNPNGEMGLFDYQNKLAEQNKLPIDVLTKFFSVYRENPSNPRKNYYAMCFDFGNPLAENTRQKMVDELIQLDSKLNTKDRVEMDLQEAKEHPVNSSEDMEGINPDDIPF